MYRAKRSQVLILLASGFEESSVIVVAQTLRRAGFPVALVGLTAGPLRGAYGLSLSPDVTLSEVETEQPLAVVLPAGVQGSRQLNADPRIHTLVRQVVSQGGYVVALDTAYTVVRCAGILPESETGRIGMSASRWHNTAPTVRVVEGLSFDRVVLEGRLIFGRDSGTAQESALTLAAFLEQSEG